MGLNILTHLVKQKQKLFEGLLYAFYIEIVHITAVTDFVQGDILISKDFKIEV